MAKGIKLKKSWRPGEHQGSIYDDVDDTNGLPHQEFMSKEAASLRLRRELMDSTGDANLADYNATFRASIEQPIIFAAASAEDLRLAETRRASEDLAFCKQLDQELAAFEQTLQGQINGHTATHEDIDRLVATFIERQTEQFQDRQEAAHEKTWAERNLHSNLPYSYNREEVRKLDNASPAARYLVSLNQHLEDQVGQTRQLNNNLRLDLTGLESRPIDDLSSPFSQAFSKKQQADLDEIQQLNRRYELDLFKAMSDLDNGLLTIHNVNVVHDVYQQAILDKIDDYERVHGHALGRDDTASAKVVDVSAVVPESTSEATHFTKLSLEAQQRFAEIREASLALRVSQNQQFMAPKSTLQHFRYDWDQDHKNKYDDATTGKAATFKVKADAIYNALTPPELTAAPAKTIVTPPAVTLPPFTAEVSTSSAPVADVVPAKPTLPTTGTLTPKITSFNKEFQAFNPANTLTEHTEQSNALKEVLKHNPPQALTYQSAELPKYLQDCQTYLDYHSPQATAKRVEKEVDALQGRIVVLLEKNVTNDVEVAAITNRLNALKPPASAASNPKIDTALLEVAAVDKYFKDTAAVLEAEKEPGKQVDALQRRIVELDKKSKVTPYDAAACAAEATAITDGLTALKPPVAPEKYHCHTVMGDPSVTSTLTKEDHANSFVRIANASNSAVYFVDEKGTVTPVTTAAGTAFLNQFPKTTDVPPVEVSAATASKYLPEQQQKDQALATKITKAEGEVEQVQAFYPLATEFKTIQDNLTQHHEEYAAAARPLLDIEYNFEPTSAKQQLDDLTKGYTAKCEKTSEQLTALKAKVEANTGLPPLTVDQKKNFNEQCVALEKAQKEHLAAATKEVQTLRAEADTTFERFNRNYQWDRLINDPFNEDPNHKLTEEQKKKLLDKDSDPEELLKRLLPAGGDAQLQVGFMTLRRNTDGSYDIDLSDAFSGKGAFYEYLEKGKVSVPTAFLIWMSSGQRSRDIEATLTDTRRLDNLGMVLQGIKDPKTNSIYHHCNAYDNDSYNKMKAVFLAAKAQGIGFNLDSCFANSFHTRKNWLGIQVKMSPEEKATLREKMRNELAQYDAQLKDSNAINQSCRDLTLHGMQPGSPNLDAVQAKDLNSTDFMKAALSLSHIETSLKGRLAEPGVDPVKAVQESLQHMKNLNLKQVSGIAPSGGNHNGSSAAMLGIALEREHFISLLDLKKQELATIRAEINRLEASGTLPPWSPELADLRQQANSASQTLDQEAGHFDLLCRQQGCQVDRAGRQEGEQLADRRAEVVRRDATVSGQDKQVASNIVTTLSNLDVTKPADVFTTLKQQAVALESLEKTHALSRSTANPVEKTLIEHLVTSAELAQPHKFIEGCPVNDRANTIDARLCAAREEIAVIESAGHQALQAAQKTLAELPASADKAVRETAALKVTELKAKQGKGFLTARIEETKNLATAAGRDPLIDPAVKNLQALQQYQQLDTNRQAARSALTTAEVERGRLNLKGVDPTSKEALALDKKVLDAKGKFDAIEKEIMAQPQPASLTKLCTDLTQAQEKLQSVQVTQNASVDTVLTNVSKSEPLKVPKSNEAVCAAIKAEPLENRLARIESLHASITELKQLVTVTPEQADQQRQFLRSAQVQYHAVIDATKSTVLSTLNNDVITPQAKIDTLQTAAKILAHSDPAIRAYAQDDHKVMGMAQQGMIAVQHQRHVQGTSTLVTPDTFASELVKIVDKFALPQASPLAELKTYLKGDAARAPAFADRAGVFSSPEKTTAAQQDLGKLINLESQIKDQIKATVPSQASTIDRLNITLKETQNYRASLVQALKTEATRVLREGGQEECGRVKDTFSKTDLALDKEKLPASAAMVKMAPTIVAAVDQKIVTLNAAAQASASATATAAPARK